jgi:hypothetical protein
MPGLIDERITDELLKSFSMLYEMKHYTTSAKLLSSDKASLPGYIDNKTPDTFLWCASSNKGDENDNRLVAYRLFKLLTNQ